MRDGLYQLELAGSQMIISFVMVANKMIFACDAMKNPFNKDQDWINKAKWICS